MRLALILVSFCSLSFAQQTVTVDNAAAYGLVPASSFAPGSMIRVSGSLGAPLPNDAAIQVLSAGAASAVDVRILPSPGLPLSGRFLALLPADLPSGPAELRVISAGQTAGSAQITIVDTAPALFTNAGDGTGPAVAQRVAPSQGPVLNSLANPVLPGEYITLWGTGLGRALSQDVLVEVGGRPVWPAYAGPAPGFPGLDQINVPLPVDAPEGCYISVRVRVGQTSSNLATVSVAGRPGVCVHPFGLAESALRALDAGQAIRFALSSISSTIDRPTGAAPTDTTVTRTESASAAFDPRDAAAIARLAQPMTVDERYFTCQLVNPFTIAAFLRADEFDAGDKLTLTGPDRVLELPKAAIPNLYTGFVPIPDPVASPKDLPAPFFAAGLWQWSAPGGKTAAAFQQNTTLPPPLHWTNRDAITAVNRSADLTVTWDAAGYTDEVVTATLSTAYFVQALPAGARASAVSCNAPASAGRLTIPAALMSQIPAQRMPPGATLSLRLAPRPWSRDLFSVPAADGSAVPGVFSPSWTDTLRPAIR